MCSCDLDVMRRRSYSIEELRSVLCSHCRKGLTTSAAKVLNDIDKDIESLNHLTRSRR